MGRASSGREAYQKGKRGEHGHRPQKGLAVGLAHAPFVHYALCCKLTRGEVAGVVSPSLSHLAAARLGRPKPRPLKVVALRTTAPCLCLEHHASMAASMGPASSSRVQLLVGVGLLGLLFLYFCASQQPGASAAPQQLSCPKGEQVGSTKVSAGRPPARPCMHATLATAPGYPCRCSPTQLHRRAA